MGYNLKNARNGNSLSKMAKFEPLALKSEFIRQFKVLENLEYICGI